MMQGISNEVLRLYCGGYLLWLCVCIVGVAYTELKIYRSFSLKHLITIPFYGVMFSFAVPVLLISGLGIVSFLFKLIGFVITGGF